MMAKKTADINTKSPVHILMCIKNKNRGKAARASTIKNRALRAESLQWEDSENSPAILDLTVKLLYL